MATRQPVTEPVADVDGSAAVGEEGRDVVAALACALARPSAHGVVVVDLSQVPSPSSVTVAALLEAQRACRQRGLRLVLRGLSRQGRRLFRDAGLDAIFDVEPQGRTMPASPRPGG